MSNNTINQAIYDHVRECIQAAHDEDSGPYAIEYDFGVFAITPSYDFGLVGEEYAIQWGVFPSVIVSLSDIKDAIINCNHDKSELQELRDTLTIIIDHIDANP